MPLRQAVEARMREELCPRCVRFTADRRCSLPSDRECSLFRNLAEVVAIVRDTRGETMAVYERPLRESVCAACHYEDDHGSCTMRNELDCALDTYFPLIVEVIETELERGWACN